MVRASLQLTVPKRIWIGEVSRQFPETCFRVRSARSCDGIGVGLVELQAEDIPAVLEEVEGRKPVHSVDPLQVDEGRALVQIEAENPILLRVLEKTGAPIEMPFEITDGRVDWTVTTTRQRLSSLGSELDHSKLEYIVDHIWDSAEFEHVLTDRQKEVVEAAIEAGYYDSPRGCTQEELADRLAMAKSTCSEILHRAEERIVKQFETDAPAGYSRQKASA